MSSAQPSVFNGPLVEGAVNRAHSLGVSIDTHYDPVSDFYEVTARNGNRRARIRTTGHDVLMFGETVIASTIDKCVRDVCDAEEFEVSTKSDNDKARRIAELETELQKYKVAVKQLSFDLEMATSNKSYATNVETERVIRKFALEQAAEYLNDHGVIRNSTELEAVCQQIKKLHPTRDIRMGQAAAQMNAMFGTKNEVPF